MSEGGLSSIMEVSGGIGRMKVARLVGDRWNPFRAKDWEGVMVSIFSRNRVNRVFQLSCWMGTVLLLG
ncbi:MAG TPA: hypothetical protein PK360_10485, partial [bacterium]|nr:hypothetical protein [bacterium]